MTITREKREQYINEMIKLHYKPREYTPRDETEARIYETIAKMTSRVISEDTFIGAIGRRTIEQRVWLNSDIIARLRYDDESPSDIVISSHGIRSALLKKRLNSILACLRMPQIEQRDYIWYLRLSNDVAVSIDRFIESGDSLTLKIV